MVALEAPLRDKATDAWQDVDVAEGDWNLAFDALDLSVPAPCVNVSAPVVQAPAAFVGTELVAPCVGADMLTADPPCPRIHPLYR